MATWNRVEVKLVQVDHLVALLARIVRNAVLLTLSLASGVALIIGIVGFGSPILGSLRFRLPLPADIELIESCTAAGDSPTKGATQPGPRGIGASSDGSTGARSTAIKIVGPTRAGLRWLSEVPDRGKPVATQPPSPGPTGFRVLGSAPPL